MPGDPVNFSFLHRICKLVVLLCFLHISVTVVFYVRSLDFRVAFVQNQQSNLNFVKPAQVRTTGLSAGAEPVKEEPKITEEQKAPEEPVTKLEKCPETSPLLGKSNRAPVLRSRESEDQVQNVTRSALLTGLGGLWV